VTRWYAYIVSAVIVAAGIAAALSASSWAIMLAALVSAAAGGGALLKPNRDQGSESRLLLINPGMHARKRVQIAEELSVLEDAQELQRDVFEVSAELVGCVDESDARVRFAAAMRRYWSFHDIELLLWERGKWRSLGGALAGAPPQVSGPLLLPHENNGDLILDLSPGVSGQASLILRQAVTQPSLKGRSEADQRYVAEVLRGQLALSLRRVVLYGDLQRLARTDPLTETHRRWFGDKHLADLVNAGEVVALAMVDIDHFKIINDKFGHAAGDKVLSAVGHVLSAYLRPQDLICRYGGEEFLVILPSTSYQEAHGIAESLRKAVANLRGLPAPVTVSIGVASCHQDDTVGEVVRRSDQALYEAKKNGRNQVALADESEQAGTIRTTARRQRKADV
jgi:diguanylate cyclase (GGDEF)-like protein